MSVVCRLKINHERDVHCALFLLGLLVQMRTPLHSQNLRSTKLPTKHRILLLSYAGNYVCYGENYT